MYAIFEWHGSDYNLGERTRASFVSSRLPLLSHSACARYSRVLAHLRNNISTYGFKYDIIGFMTGSLNILSTLLWKSDSHIAVLPIYDTNCSPTKRKIFFDDCQSVFDSSCQTGTINADGEAWKTQNRFRKSIGQDKLSRLWHNKQINSPLLWHE